MDKYTFKDGTVLEIHQDDDAPNPRKEDDNATKMVCMHRRYKLGDTHDYNSGDYNGWSELREHLIECDDACEDLISPLYLFDHSGITISMDDTQFRARDVVGWDWGQVGWIYITNETLQKEWGGDKEKALACMRAEVKIYDQYLRNDVWGYVIKRANTCETCNHTEYDVLDSCDGFYGSDLFENGIVEHLKEEYRMELAAMLGKDCQVVATGKNT